MRAVGKGDGEWEPERAEGEWKVPGNGEQEKCVKWSKAGECAWKCSLELGEAQLAQPRTGLEYKNEVGTEDIWRVTDSSLVEGVGSALMPESLFFLLWFLDTPGSIAASLGERLLQWLLRIADNISVIFQERAEGLLVYNCLRKKSQLPETSECFSLLAPVFNQSGFFQTQWKRGLSCCPAQGLEGGCVQAGDFWGETSKPKFGAVFVFA